MDLVSESFAAWIGGGGRTQIHGPDFVDVDYDDNDVNGGGIFEDLAITDMQITQLERAADKGTTVEEQYRTFIIPLEEESKSPQRKQEKRGGGDFRLGMLTMLGQLPLK